MTEIIRRFFKRERNIVDARLLNVLIKTEAKFSMKLEPYRMLGILECYEYLIIVSLKFTFPNDYIDNTRF